MNWLLIAGGIFLTPASAPQAEMEVETINHTLVGEPIPAREVVCRNRWGTPMLPDGKGGYSLIQPIVPAFIQQSLVQPPKTDGPIFRPEGR